MPPFVREVGAGPGVVCLHSNSSSSGQWRPLLDALAPKFHVFAADSYGSGKSPPFPEGRQATLRDEVELLEPVFARAGDPFVIVGHSYGATLALMAALANPQRIRALALYEPVLFWLLEAEKSPPNDADGIRSVMVAGAAEIAAGNARGAAALFIDYWTRPGTFASMPEPMQAPILQSVVNFPLWEDALMKEPTPLSAFGALTMPVLYITGTKSTASALGGARLMQSVLPNVQPVKLDGLGHMAPIMSPAPVMKTIVEFLEKL